MEEENALKKNFKRKLLTPEETREINGFQMRDSFSIYKVFYLLEAANNYAKEGSTEHGDVIPVFAADNPFGKTLGSKTYPVTGYETLWKRCKETEDNKRNFYETLLPDIKCHMHIDAEFNKTNNKDANEKWLDETFKFHTIELMVELGFIGSDKDVRIITLVSSNDKKFSKHYILKMKNACFSNNYHCGAFIRRLKAKIDLKYGVMDKNPFYFWDEKEKNFVINPMAPNKTFFADLTIYTKRRQFRLCYSTKFAKPGNPLLTEKEFEAKQKGEKIIMNKESFLDAFIQRVEPGCKIMECDELDGSKPKSIGHKRVIQKGLNGNAGEGLLTLQQLVNNGNKKSQLLEKDLAMNCLTNNNSDPINVHKSNDLTQNDQPNVCFHMKDMISRQLKEGQTNACLYSRETNTVTIGTTCKICEIKAQARNGDRNAIVKHENNHVYFVVNLKTRKYYQKCPSGKVCSNKKGLEYDIPLAYVKHIVDFEEKERKKYTSTASIDFIIERFSFHTLIDSSDKIAFMCKKHN